MKSNEIRKRFFSFFEKRGHSIIPSSSLIPTNDPSVLFITAGMQPLVPYLLGEKHPSGTRLVNVQKAVRTVDMEEIGDDTHHTFFEMLGNWSLGDYFKEEAIKWSFKLLTDKEEGFGLDPKRLYITVFEGDSNAPADEESKKIWMSLGIPEQRIYSMSAKDNWWSPGDNGPCGPDTEMFYDVSENGLGDLSIEEFKEADERQDVIEIWNDVFMEYRKKDGVIVGKLERKNVDTGAGLERLARVLQGVKSNYDTDLFSPLMETIRSNDLSLSEKNTRIIADHIRTSVFLCGEGVTPSNTDRGYVLRRLIRRAVLKTKNRTLKKEDVSSMVDVIVDTYKESYPELKSTKEDIKSLIYEEVTSFESTLETGLKEFNKIHGDIGGEEAFNLFSTHGFPIEVTEELAREKGVSVDKEGFNTRLENHKNLSRKGAEKKFKGGLADHSEEAVKYHTTTHLLNAALRNILGEHIEQKGSNITSERLRFDFSHPEKLTQEEKQLVEDWVNEKIRAKLPVIFTEMSLEDAREDGALGVFGEKYAEKVKVYKIGEEGSFVSSEICGGPHVENTSELGVFKIKKEESSSSGVRRIKAVLEK